MIFGSQAGSETRRRTLPSICSVMRILQGTCVARGPLAAFTLPYRVLAPTFLPMKQTAVSFSTPEAELVSGLTGYQKTTIPALDLWEVMCPKMGLPMFHEDNQAMIMVINSGRNPTMRHIGRVHRVPLAWIHERLGRHSGRDQCVLFYHTSENMSADIYTKAFEEKPAWQQACRLINILPPTELGKEAIFDWMLERGRLANIPAEDIDQRAGCSTASKRREARSV